MTVELLGCESPPQQNALLLLGSLLGDDENSRINGLRVDENGNVTGMDLCRASAIYAPSVALGVLFHAVKELRVIDCPNLTDISPVCGMRNLESLAALKCPRLSHFPTNLCNHCTNLEELRLQLKQLPPEIASYTNLKTLVLYCDFMNEIPEEIGNFVFLEELELWAARKKNLPRSIGNLSRLRKLTLLFGDMTELPNELGGLVSLQELALGYCRRLKSIPAQVLKLQRLQNLWFYDCDNLCIPPNDILDCTDSLVNVDIEVPPSNPASRLTFDLMVRLNKAGRRLHREENVIPQALWSRVLERCSNDTDCLYFFLKQNPDLGKNGGLPVKASVPKALWSHVLGASSHDPILVFYLLKQNPDLLCNDADVVKRQNPDASQESSLALPVSIESSSSISVPKALWSHVLGGCSLEPKFVFFFLTQSPDVICDNAAGLKRRRAA